MKITDEIEEELIDIWARACITRHDEGFAIFLAEKYFEGINPLTVGGIFSEYCYNTGC